ncbi:MAG: sugar ABC transporter permease [Actinomycetes bacterium]
MVLPALTIYAFLYLYPALSNLAYALQRWDGVTKAKFVGLHNFVNMTNNDDLLHKVVGNSFKFTFFVVIFQTAASLFFATFLVKNTKTNIALRTLYFFPTILSSVSVGLIWTFLYDPNFGFVNAIFKKVGLNSFALNWLGSEKTSLYAIAFSQVWFHTGQMMVIYIAGLQQIPAELYEAAEVDGASRWQQFKSVTWPMAMPTTAVVVAYTTIQSFRAFDLIYSMTQGGPQNSSNILVTLIYNTAFSSFRFGYASAESILLVVVVLVITWLQRRVLRINTGEK